MFSASVVADTGGEHPKARHDQNLPSGRTAPSCNSATARRDDPRRSRYRLWGYRHQRTLRVQASRGGRRNTLARNRRGHRVGDPLVTDRDCFAQIRHPDLARRQSRRRRNCSAFGPPRCPVRAPRKPARIAADCRADRRGAALRRRRDHARDLGAQRRRRSQARRTPARARCRSDQRRDSGWPVPGATQGNLVHR